MAFWNWSWQRANNECIYAADTRMARANCLSERSGERWAYSLGRHLFNRALGNNLRICIYT